MALLVATPDALHRVGVDTESGAQTATDPGRVLDCGVRQVHAGSGVTYAATESGILESTDSGQTWTDAGLPADDVHSVAVTDGVLAGTRPLAIYRRSGDAWTELDGLRALADREGWPTPAFRDEAWARSVAVDEVGRVLVGVEVGGLAVRDLDGSWRATGPVEADPDEHQRCDDVHQVAVRGADEWLLATGDGVHRTTDAGGTWTRLDTGPRRYARELLAGDRLWVGVNDSPPRWQPPDAAIFRGTPDALGRVDYPGASGRFVVSWTRDEGAVFAGTNDGAVLRFADGECGVVADLPVSEHAATAYGVRSLAVV
jgi:hypothetical protein